jgi:hypothetical protein
MAKQLQGKQGGARKGAGRKPQFNEPTTRVIFTVPVSKVARFKKLVAAILNKWIKKGY